MTQKRYTIHVTEQIINNACQRDSSHCMIADAVRQQIPNAVRVSVDIATIKWTDKKAGRRYVAFTPPIGQQGILKFDRGIKVEPFTMRLAVIQTLKAGGHGNPKTEPRRLVEQTFAERERGSEQTSTGGKVPPAGALSNTRGRRRAFGLRQSRL